MILTEHHHVPLSELCSFKLNGYLKKLFIINSVEELRFVRQRYPSLFVLGKGSNTLINPDHNYDAVIKLDANITSTQVTETQLKVSASTSVNKLLSLSKKHELSGLEFCAGVPASVGGMVTMNFGCWGSEISQLISLVTIMTKQGEIKTITTSDCEFEYRNSAIKKNNWIVLDATFNLQKEDKKTIQSNIKSSINERLTKQPLRESTFGSIFKNPHPLIAAKLIEASNLKGKKFHNVKISNRHANFLENVTNANYHDTINAIEKVQKIVLNEHQVTLTKEVELLT